MSRIYVEYAGLRQVGGNCKAISSKVNTIQSKFQNTVRQLDWDIKYEADINKTANQLIRKLENYSKVLKQYQKFIDDAYDVYVKMDEYGENKGVWETFKDELAENYGWKDILKGSNYIIAIIELAKEIKDVKSWDEFRNTGKKVYDFLEKAGVTYNNYKKIGRAVGGKRATCWYLKNITGLRTLGRVSTAKNPAVRFKNNLTNKTSPFNFKAKMKNVLGDFTGKNGVKKAVSSWGTVAVTGVLNWFGNKEEQAASNGKMSDGRVAAETVTETAVDTLLMYGTGVLVGSAVATVMGTVAATGIVSAAVSSLVIATANAGVKAVTEKTTTEWISDIILDAGKTLIEEKWNAVKTISKPFGKWFDKMAFR